MSFKKFKSKIYIFCYKIYYKFKKMLLSIYMNKESLKKIVQMLIVKNNGRKITKKHNRESKHNIY